MTPPTQHLDPQQAARTIRILILAMLTGLLLFVGVVAFLISAGAAGTAPEQSQIFGLVLGGLGLGFLAASALTSKAATAKGPKIQGDTAEQDQRRLATYFTSKLLKVALAEGFGVAGTVFLFVTGDWYFLAAAAISASALVAQLPRASELSALSHNIGPGASTHGTAIEP